MKPYVCPYENCNKSFNEKGNLMTHYRVHTNEKPFICTYKNCDKAFKAHGHLKDHMKKHFNIRPYVCMICYQKFSRNSTLKMHLNTHVNTKPYVCPSKSCNKRFIDKAQIKYHMKSHYKDLSKDEFESLFSNYIRKTKDKIDMLILNRNKEMEMKTCNVEPIKPQLPKFVRTKNSYDLLVNVDKDSPDNQFASSDLPINVNMDNSEMPQLHSNILSISAFLNKKREKSTTDSNNTSDDPERAKCVIAEKTKKVLEKYITAKLINSLK